VTDVVWVDGRVVSAREPLVHLDDSAFREGRGCFTTARWTGSSVRFEARHLARLKRDAELLAIGPVDRDAALRAFHELGGAAFGDAEGVLRLQASRRSDGSVLLSATARALGPPAEAWRAITLPIVHDGAALFAGAKVSNRLLYGLAMDRVTEAGVDEGLLFDARDRLVEGTRTNLVAVGEDDAARVPPEARGAVAGIALEVASEAEVGLVRRDVARAEMPGLRELVALNAVRGAVPIVEIDGRPVGDGRPGPVSVRLAAALDAAP